MNKSLFVLSEMILCCKQSKDHFSKLELSQLSTDKNKVDKSYKHYVALVFCPMEEEPLQGFY